VKPFIRNNIAVQQTARHRFETGSPMSIRRDLLLRSALLRLPGIAALRDAPPVKAPEAPARPRAAIPHRRRRPAAPTKA
jgi:hypothetical protein